MNSSLPRVLVALLVFAFVLAACSSDTGSEWTPAPVDGEAPTETTAPDEPAATDAPAEPTAAPAEPTAAPVEPTAAPVEPTEPAATVEPDEPAASEAPVEPPSGEARVIELQADSALRFTDTSGQPVPDIAVTPGETVVFRVDNTAGFEHNMYIGTDAELSLPNGTTDVGLPSWSTGVQEFEWVVPDDITDLKFACTVPGHYYSMQGTFSLAEAAPEAPAAEAAPAEPTEPEAEATPEAPQAPAEPLQPAEPDAAAAPANGEARVIELEADAAIRFLQGGEQIREIPVTPGETVIFRVDNTAGFPHNFYIGPDDELRVMGGTTDTGIPDWNIGVQEMEWVVPEDLTGVRFACTVPGHYYTMQGDFVISQ